MQYEELDLHSHTLKRPDTYIGSIRSQESDEYVAAIDENNSIQIKMKTTTFTPAILRIFIEALSNAVDNVSRSIEYATPCKAIKVNINKETGEITIWNDGLSIPVKHHQESNTWIPDMLFGRLLTSSNYNDDEERLTSGRNGLGISLTNIFSKSFKVKLVDSVTKQSYSQKWSDNMKVRQEPKITKVKTKGFTQVSWIPDFQYFGFVEDGYTSDFVSLLYKYVIDAAMIVGDSNVNVYLNDIKLPVRQFKDYAKLYSDAVVKEILHIKGDTSQCVLLPSTEYESISFVNGVHTRKGGAHVDCWADAIFKALAVKLNAKYKSLKLTVRDIKPYFKIFVNCTVPNPEFETQSKNKLVAPRITANIDPKHITALMKWEFVQDIEKMIAVKEMMTLKKSETKRVSKIIGYDPANNAGKKESGKCTLILCEGLSAKPYAARGIEQGSYLNEDEKMKGRDWHGILCLKGKGLNVRNATSASVSENKELTNIIQALGLQYNTDYSIDENFKKLRYGRVMCLCDFDVDGFHIQGLLLNFFDYLFPSLLRRTGFMTYMQTPIMKIDYKNESIRFYDMNKAHQFIKSHPNTALKIKYYKGLGTSNDKDVRETFGKRVVLYEMDENAQQILNSVFNKDQSDFRKTWIRDYAGEDIQLQAYGNHLFSFTISDFINKEFIKFSIDDCKRSLPHILDGLKESQRKILYACFLKNMTSALKVAQLAGFVAEKTNYHHGEENLFDTITKMAQDFVCSNNIPLLENDGQFGSRLAGGKDASNARYIFTKLASVTRHIFHSDDDEVLTFINDEGDMVEPESYYPIIPMILVNGITAAIGTGWSCSIPCYNPKDVIGWIKKWLRNEPNADEMHPWYNNFTGEIRKLSSVKYETYGVINVHDKKVTITELPVGVWTDKYKEFLEDLRDSKKIKNLKNYSTPDDIHFEFTSLVEYPPTLDNFKLKSSLSLTNMVLFGKNGTIKRYASINDIMNEFCDERLKCYSIRKHAICEKLRTEYATVKNKLRFLKAVMNDDIVIHKRSETEIISQLNRMEFSNIEHLLNLPIKSFSTQAVAALGEKKQKLKTKLEYVVSTSEHTMWNRELDELLKVI